MTAFTRAAVATIAIVGLSACAQVKNVVSTMGDLGGPERSAALQPGEPALYPNETPELRVLINKWADHYGVPRDLVHRQIVRESSHRPGARNGPYYGLMQILPQTARTMGYRGAPEGLLDADTNLQYAVKYLRGAWLVSGGNRDEAVMWYARGYYYEAKRLGLLEETGLRT
ncbi:lytic transglycosylase domain-containing protein [Maritimibacter fusiformis]|uniref:Lytic transglycosylase domain-containing protein n=1 Tax=Maritimibacter fusiformis TaxID=2603819 RepID=A0A5D0RL76_9RHOB|nr:lytic transglycosylase domain-containing protein [Maritimibacter fusiformis]TYB81284.1 lytic transglycosylase domain-containing protein [Maritimibacter fusiformis]